MIIKYHETGQNYTFLYNFTNLNFKTKTRIAEISEDSKCSSVARE